MRVEVDKLMIERCDKQTQKDIVTKREVRRVVRCYIAKWRYNTEAKGNQHIKVVDIHSNNIAINTYTIFVSIK